MLQVSLLLQDHHILPDEVRLSRDLLDCNL